MIARLRILVCRAFALVFILGAITGTMSGAALAQRQGGEPGQFDYYLLSLSWAPSFCVTARGAARAQECGQRAGFVVHGLWPQFDNGGFPENCQVPPPRLDRRIVSATLDLMPASRLIYHEWDAHGTCSGLEQHDYFDLIRKARGVVTIPPQFDGPQQSGQASPDDVADAFVKANPGLAPDDIVVACDRNRLSEVRICLTRALAFRSCGASARAACRADSIAIPPVRGR